MASTSIPKTQKGVIIEKNGGTEVLQYKTDLPVPQPKDGEILVKNEYIGVNYIDTYFRTGLYPAPSFPLVLGREAEGTIISLPSSGETYGLQVGDRVVYMSTETYREYHAFPISKATKIPSSLSSKPGVAAAAYLQGLTALTLVHESAGLPIKKGEHVLVHAAAGGVGLLLVQILKDLGARVIGTASTTEKLEEAKKNGAEFVINYVEDKDTLVQKVKELTPGGEGVRVVFDGTGAGQFENDLLLLRRKGVLVSFGNSAGAVPPFAISRLAQKSISIIRPTLFSYVVTKEELDHYTGLLFDLLASGKVNIKIHETYPLEDVARAHQDLESRKTTGKLLLKV